MAVVGNAVVKISAESAEFTKGTEDARKKSNGFFKELQANYGRQSTLAKSLKILSGGGAILGIGLAAKEFAHLGEQVKDITLKIHEGGHSAGEIADEFAKAIPILGNVYSGLKDIIGAMSGISGEVADIEASTKLTEAITEAMQQRGKAISAVRVEINKLIDDLDHRIRSLPLGPTQKEFFDTAHDLYKERAAQLAKPEADEKSPEVLATQTKINDARKQLLGMRQGGLTADDLDEHERLTLNELPEEYTTKAVAEANAKLKSAYDDKASQIKALEDQLAKRKADAITEANLAVSKIDETLVAEAVANFKKLATEKLTAAGEAVAPVIAHMAQSQQEAIEFKLGEFFKFEDQMGEHVDDIRSRVKSLVQETSENPYQNYLDMAKELQAELSGGKITPLQFNKALGGMQRELIGTGYQHAAATESRLGGKVVESEKSPADPMATLNNLATKQLAEDQKQTTATVQIYQLLKGGTVPIVGIGR